jgi:hypothetical protein
MLGDAGRKLVGRSRSMSSVDAPIRSGNNEALSPNVNASGGLPVNAPARNIAGGQQSHAAIKSR